MPISTSERADFRPWAVCHSSGSEKEKQRPDGAAPVTEVCRDHRIEAHLNRLAHQGPVERPIRSLRPEAAESRTRVDAWNVLLARI